MAWVRCTFVGRTAPSCDVAHTYFGLSVASWSGVDKVVLVVFLIRRAHYT